MCNRLSVVSPSLSLSLSPFLSLARVVLSLSLSSHCSRVGYLYPRRSRVGYLYPCGVSHRMGYLYPRSLRSLVRLARLARFASMSLD